MSMLLKSRTSPLQTTHHVHVTHVRDALRLCYRPGILSRFTDNALCLMLQTTRNKKYRFSVILDELRAPGDVAYKTILLELVNCLIIYTEKIEDRIRIRNEFFGE